MASRRLVLPWPFWPLTTLKRGDGTRSTRARLRKSRIASETRRSVGNDNDFESDAHGHDDGDVARRLRLGSGHDHRGIELAGEADRHLFLVDGGEHVEEVLRVEADGHLGTG